MLGLNWFDVERLPYAEFRQWVKALDKVRRDREKEAKEARRRGR